jgi:hypothetical protein
LKLEDFLRTILPDFQKSSYFNIYAATDPEHPNKWSIPPPIPIKKSIQRKRGILCAYIGRVHSLIPNGCSQGTTTNRLTEDFPDQFISNVFLSWPIFFLTIRAWISKGTDAY